MQPVCPKCSGAMVIVTRSLSGNIASIPFIDTTIKNYLPPELKRYSSVEIHVCQKCGYCEIFWK